MVAGDEVDGVGGKGRDVLTPVPEDFEESRESVDISLVEGGESRVTFSRSLPPKEEARGSETAAPSTSDPPGESKCTIGKCVFCGGPSNEFSEEVIALCVVVVGTYCSRLPRMVPSYIVSRIIPAFTRSVPEARVQER